jgi:hypothetical protein
VSCRPSSETYRFELTDLLHLSLILRQLSVVHLIQTLCRPIFSQSVEVVDSVCFLTVLCLPPAAYYLHADQVIAGFGAIRDAVQLHSNNWWTCVKPFVKYDNESLNKHFSVLKPSKSVTWGFRSSRMWCYVTGLVVPDTWRSLLGVLYLDEKGTMFLQNTGNLSVTSQKTWILRYISVETAMWRQ